MLPGRSHLSQDRTLIDRLQDSIFEHMSHDDFRTSIDPKVHGSWNLHQALPSHLDFFILLSSIGGVIGAPSQANYAAGNNFKDALARYRYRQGDRHTFSLDLGMMLSAGVVAEIEGLLEHLQRIGWFMPISQSELQAVLDYYCDPALEINHEDECQAVIGIETPAGLAAQDIDEPEWMGRSMFRHFRKLRGAGQEESSAATRDAKGGVVDSDGIAAKLKDAVSKKATTAVLVEGVRRKLAKTLSIPEAEIDSDRPFNTFGVDSLSGLEIRKWFSKQAKVDVAVFDVLGRGSIENVCATAAEKIRTSE